MWQQQRRKLSLLILDGHPESETMRHALTSVSRYEALLQHRWTIERIRVEEDLRSKLAVVQGVIAQASS